MPSRSLLNWRGARARELDEIAAAHRAVGGAGPGRRYATRQVNHAYLVLLASQFQGFCRDLHSEAVDHVIGTLPATDLRGSMLRARLLEARQLDARNAQPASIGSDFGRFVMDFWQLVTSRHARNTARQADLERLNAWRNAIAHQHFDPHRLGGRTSARLGQVRRFRAACNTLAGEFDAVVAAHLAAILGRPPW
jgi:hypothetical protein